MTNTTLLQEKIAASGMKIGFIAKSVGISRQQFGKKVQNKVPFNQLEIDALCGILHITSLREKEAIFFAKQ